MQFNKKLRQHYKLPQKLPRFRELFNKNRYIFLNSQPFIDFPKPQPFPEKIIHFGGIALPEHHVPITENDLQVYINNKIFNNFAEIDKY